MNLSKLNAEKIERTHNAESILRSKGPQSPQYKQALAELDATIEHINLLTQAQEMSEAAGLNNRDAAPVYMQPIVTGVVESKEVRREKYNRAFRSMLISGYSGNSAEQRDITISTDGAAMIPQEFDSAYVEALKFYGPIANLVKVRNVSNGAPQKFSITDDTAASMKYLVETGATGSLEADPTLSSQIPNSDTLVTMIKYSIQEVQDAFDLGTFIQNAAGLRVARAVEYGLTNGTDNTTAHNVLPSSPTGGLLGGVSSAATLATLGTIPYSALVTLAGSVDHAYYVNGSYMASPSVFNYLVAQVDSTGKPLYKFDKETGLLMIAGKPLVVNNAYPAISTPSAPVITFGDYSRQYAYVNGGGIRIKTLTERFADTLERAAIIYHRIGATNLLSTAVKSLVNPAS